MIGTDRLTYAYPGAQPVLDGVTLAIEPGSHVALMGRNGSGKTTLALILKGLYAPTGGSVTVDGMSLDGEESRFEAMKRVGLVFQNPDDAIVATTVERELAFGLENLALPQEEMRRRIDDALERFDLGSHRHTNPLHLSGGEKQRLALAGVMIMEPAHLILDEPTSLLDPWSRGHILDLIHDAAQQGTTVIHITQFSEEALAADRLMVLDGGRIVGDGLPSDILADLGRPQFLTEENRLSRRRAERETGDDDTAPLEPVLSLDAVSHRYQSGTPFEAVALENVSLAFHRGSATAVFGPTGSGKTTLLEIAAGVTEPSAGGVAAGKGVVRAMAFQFPEDQVFGDTVGEFLSFGPRNRGKSEKDAGSAARLALEAVGLEPSRCLERDPFTLSGGERRRVALAGVLAMKPDALLLDEPTAGLDCDGVGRILGILDEYVSSGGTLVFSTHDFAFARLIADRAVVMDAGRVECEGRIGEVFGRSGLLGMVSSPEGD